MTSGPPWQVSLFGLLKGANLAGGSGRATGAGERRVTAVIVDPSQLMKPATRYSVQVPPKYSVAACQSLRIGHARFPRLGNNADLINVLYFGSIRAYLIRNLSWLKPKLA
jgi:hypothetical protein